LAIIELASQTGLAGADDGLGAIGDLEFGMAIIGSKILVTGRWTGLARVWPTIAESWAIVTVPALVVFGATAGWVVGVGHLLVGYVALGLIIVLRPHLTGAR
jgi:hypothetical protein